MLVGLTNTWMPANARHPEIVAAAIKDEVGEWRPRSDGWCFWPIPHEPYTCVHVFHSGAFHVNGRLADKVRHFPGSRPHDHIGYVGLKWGAR